MAGVFIVLEGGEGCGKSTQVGALVEHLRNAGHDVVATFEPGATARGAALRRFLLADESPLAERAELLVMAADRAQHVAEVVGPALARGAVVVSDRYAPSSLVYQGVGRGLGVEAVAAISDFAAGGLVPDVVVVLDVDDATAAARRPVAEDRMEKAGAEFHQRVRQAYRDLAATFGWTVVDARGAVDDVTAAVLDAVLPTITSR